MKLSSLFAIILSLCKSYSFECFDEIRETKSFGFNPKQFIPEGLNVQLQTTEESHQANSGERIFGGQDAPRNAFPYQVVLDLRLKSGLGTSCGGSLIFDKYVLTAAHCLTDVVNATVILGAYDSLNDTEIGRQTQVVTRKNFIVHKSWSPKNIRNDIALIKLNILANFTEFVQPVALAAKEFQSIDGKPAIITGWGFYNGSNLLSQNLQFAESVIISNTDCKKTFGTLIRDTNICLDGSKGHGTCHGDSGGPMVVVGMANQLVQVGITSFGSGDGCDKLQPNVFTRITKYLTWISRYTKIKF